MGQDYSYTQPSSSSEELDITSLIVAEGELYANEVESTAAGHVNQVTGAFGISKCVVVLRVTGLCFV
ncbi:hypothetical protein Bca52824_085796 [Brassica carinata]|uniref:Uncharacterized protein n=1 Tax=Brassica carinata TaxID=52824 RepID=A0A8X7P8F6_BRACI|nr:hypothetical protein Bca52824_085796 [Brassica carinata]